MLTFHKIEKRKNDMTLLPTFSCTMEQNQIYAIYSTVNIREQLLQLLQMNTSPSSGDIFIDGAPLTKKNKRQIYIHFLHDMLYDHLTVKEMLQFLHRMIDTTERIDALLSFVSLEEKANTRVHRLQFSERKRLQFAYLLLQDAKVLMLEEPDQNIDLESKQILMKVLQRLKELGKTICLLTTNMESALNYGDIVFRIDDKGLHEVEMKHEEKEAEINNEAIPITLEKIPSKIDDKIILFDPFEIDYIESNDGVSHSYINGDAFPSTSTLAELEIKLFPFGFFRCHRSYIVNLQKVREVITWTRNSYSLILDDEKKTTIPLSKSKMATLKEMLGM